MDLRLTERIYRISLNVNEQFATKQDLVDAVAQLASKQDLDAVRVELKEDISGMRHEMADLETRLTDKLTEAIRDTQTEVLRAFYDWARPIEVRVNRTDELAQRMSWLENRISELERRKRAQ